MDFNHTYIIKLENLILKWVALVILEDKAALCLSGFSFNCLITCNKGFEFQDGFLLYIYKKNDNIRKN